MPHLRVLVAVLLVVLLPSCCNAAFGLSPAEALSDVPRPVLPLHFFVDQGEVACLNGTGVPCSGLTQGQIHAWYQFDPATGLLDQYREDSVLFDPTPHAKQPIVYSREYSNLTQATYYYLPTDTSSALQCFKTPFGFFNYSRAFLRTAKYVGVSEPLGSLSRGKKAHTFEAQWLLDGQPIDVVAWVLVDRPDAIWGYHFLTIAYMMYHYYDMGPNGFDPSPFIQPVGVSPCPLISTRSRLHQ